jgi:antitoxin ParD1/3/4
MFRQKERTAMAKLNVSVSDPMRDWVEDRIRSGEFASASDYIDDLIRNDRARHQALVEALIEAENSGVSHRLVEDIIADAKAKMRDGAV